VAAQLGQQGIHILTEARHDGNADDTGHIVHRTHGVHPLIGLQDELEEDHIAVLYPKIAADRITHD